MDIGYAPGRSASKPLIYRSADLGLYPYQTQPISAHTQLFAGVVRSYNVKTRVYEVTLDRLGDRECKALRIGAERPYPEKTKVVVAHFPGVDWVIFGELDTISPRTGERAEEWEEAIAETAAGASDLLLKTAKVTEQSLCFRKVDKNGIAEVPVFPGDALLQNRPEDNRQAAYVRVFDFGDILLQPSSRRTYTMYNAQQNRIRSVCRNYEVEAGGYFFQHVVATESGPTRGRATQLHSLRAQSLDSTIDQLDLRGYIPTVSSPTAQGLQAVNVVARGGRVQWGEHRVEEIDNETRTYRLEQSVGSAGAATLELGELTAENGTHPSTRFQNPNTSGGVQNATGSPVAQGLHFRIAEKFDITFDAAAGELKIAEIGGGTVHRLVMDSAGTRIERSGQFLRLTDAGLEIEVNKTTVISQNGVDVTGDVKVQGNIEATGNVSVTGNVSATGMVADALGDLNEIRTVYNTHTHPTPEGPSGPPTTPMT